MVAATFAASACVRDQGPPAVYSAIARSKRGLHVAVVLDRLVSGGDLQDPSPRFGAGGLELDQELVGLDAPLVVRLVEVLLGERADDLPAEALSADLGEKGVEILRGVLLVLGEHLDDVAKGLALELVELAALRGVHGFPAWPRRSSPVRRLEDADESARCLVVVAKTPVAPGALEECEAVERRVDLLFVREHLLVFGERAGVVELTVEQGLRLGHVRVGHEPAARVVAEDALEAIAGLVFLALLVGKEAVHVEGEVRLLEPRVVPEHPREEVARGAVVELRGRAALVDRLLLPVLEPIDERLSRVLPLQLPQAYERLGHLARLPRCLPDKLREEADRLSPELLRLGDVRVHPRVQPGLKLPSQVLRDLGATDGRGRRLAAPAAGSRGTMAGGPDGRRRRDAPLRGGPDCVRGHGRGRRRSRPLRRSVAWPAGEDENRDCARSKRRGQASGRALTHAPSA